MQKTRGMSLATIQTGTKFDTLLQSQRTGAAKPVSIAGNLWTEDASGYQVKDGNNERLGAYLYNYLGLGKRRAQDEMYLEAMSSPADYLSRKELAVQESVLGLTGQMTKDMNEYLRLGYGEEAALKASLKRAEQRFKIEEDRINKEFPSGLTKEKVKAIAASKPLGYYGGGGPPPATTASSAKSSGQSTP